MYQRLANKKDGFLRTNSICPSAESILLELVLNNETENIRKLVENNPALLSHIYTPEYIKPILLIACSEEQVQGETVKTLIELGADLHYTDDEEWEAIHFAACKTDSTTLEAVIDGLCNPGDINAVAKGSNALHILIKYGKREESPKEFVECARLLVKRGIDVNHADSRLVSPILMAAKKGYKDVVTVIIENSVIPVDLDTHLSGKKTARDIISKENMYDGQLSEKIDYESQMSSSEVLFNALRKENESAFVNFKNGDIFELVDKHDDSSTMLQLCCEKGLRKSAVHLLNKGANPNLTTQKNYQTPIEIAAEHGYYKIFAALLEHPKIEIPRKLLITLLKYYENDKFQGIDHAKCYAHLLRLREKDKTLFDINEQDESWNSPLHYAMRYADQNIVEELLEKGASLGSKNKNGFMPIQDIEPELLEKHLDKCVQFDVKGKKFDKEDFCVTFDYRTLIPPATKTELNASYDCNDSEANFNHTSKQELVAETEVISYMSEAPEFKHLLMHPVITSFLFMKWHRIRWLFYTNLAFYIAFFTSLVVYIFTHYANFEASEESTFLNFVINLSWVILLIGYFVLIFRESFQMAVSPNNYFKNLENYIEIVLIFITGAMLFIANPSDDTRKQLSSISILLAAFELVLMLGQHPKLSTNVVMLRTVSFNFFKFLAWYSLLIIAFALSFYILFTEAEEEPKNQTKTAGEGEDEDFFTDPGKSVFKTIVMLTGEFDAGSLNFHRFPLTSKIIFALFIFMIAIILLNLLNGLAVSDTQMIKNNAELVGHIARAQHIRYVESMLLGNILPANVLNKLNNLCCCFPPDYDWNLTILKPLAKRACLFPHYLNYEMTIYPNKDGQIAVHNKKGQCCFGTCSYLYLDKQTIRRTNAIIQSRREELKIKQEITYLQKIEQIMQSLNEKVNIEKSEVFLLNRKLDHIIHHLSQGNDEN